MRELDVDLLGGPVHYADFGGSGPPLVMVHGLGGSRLNWLAVGPKLAAGHRVYAVDLLGHGRTPRAGRPATLANHRRLLDAFVERVAGAPATLVGNSTGGHLSILEAALRPEAVAALVLVDPAVPVPVGGAALPPPAVLLVLPLLVRGVGEAMLRASARRLTPEQLVERTLRLVSPHPERIPQDLVRAHVEAYLARHGSAEADRAFLQTARSLTAANLRRRRFYALARRVKAPALVVQGAKDRLVPMRAIHRLLEIRPDWELQVFPELGHVPMMEDPDAFAEAVRRWLEGLGRKAA